MGANSLRIPFQPRAEKRALKFFGDCFHDITKLHAPSLILDNKDAMFEAYTKTKDVVWESQHIYSNPSAELSACLSKR